MGYLFIAVELSAFAFIVSIISNFTWDLIHVRQVRKDHDMYKKLCRDLSDLLDYHINHPQPIDFKNAHFQAICDCDGIPTGQYVLISGAEKSGEFNRDQGPSPSIANVRLLERWYAGSSAEGQLGNARVTCSDPAFFINGELLAIEDESIGAFYLDKGTTVKCHRSLNSHGDYWELAHGVSCCQGNSEGSCGCSNGEGSS